MQQRVTGFHLDDENHWVANLECGHKQHVRHDPPLVSRPWVLTPEGRQSRLGVELNCKRCDEMGQAVGRAVLSACAKAAETAYNDAGLSGLCQEGRWDIALAAMRSLELQPVIEKAIGELIEKNRQLEEAALAATK